MRSNHLLRQARSRRSLTLRQLAARADTSHSALAAYESGRKAPSVDTLERILNAAGFELEARLTPRPGDDDHPARGRELVEVLELAEEFPARPRPVLAFPIFRRP